MYLYKVFFFSFQAGNKKKNLYPVYKNDDESDPRNYRPMSLLSLLSKLDMCFHSNTKILLLVRKRFFW